MGERVHSDRGAAGCARTRLVILALLMCLGGWFRVTLVVERPIWMDEAFSITNAKESSYSELLLFRGAERLHPPLSFLLIKLSMDVFGTSAPWAVRLLPLLAGIACIPAAYFLGKLLYSPELGLWASALAALDPLLIDQSSQSRMFSYLCLGGLLTLNLLLLAIRDRTFALKHCTLLGVVLALLLWNNQLALVSWGTAAVTFGVMLLVTARESEPPGAFGRCLRGAVVTFGVAGLVASPGLLDIVNRVQHPDTTHVPPPISENIYDIYCCVRLLEPQPRLWMVVLACSAAGFLWLSLRQGLRMVPLVAVAILSFVLAVMLRHRHPFFAVRYLTPLLPAFWIGLAALPALTRFRPLKWLAVIFVSTLLAWHAWYDNDLRNTWPTHFKYAVAEDIENLSREIKPSEVVVLRPAFLAYPFGHYYDFTLDLPLEDQKAAVPGEVSPPLISPDTTKATWLIAGGMDTLDQVDAARQDLKFLADAYGLKLDPAKVEQHFAVRRFAAARLDRSSIRYVSREISEPVANWLSGHSTVMKPAK